MAFEVRLPKLSDEMKEGTISRWLKEVGDSVDKGEPLVEVETEKVIVEVEAPRAGVVTEIVAAEQAVVPVDGLLCRIGEPGERATAKQVVAGPGAGAGAAPTAAPSPAPSPAPTPIASAAPPLVHPVPTPSPAAPHVPGQRQRPAGGAAVAASPLARRVAEELAIDLTAVQGTGIGGKIVMADLQPYLPTDSASAPSTAAGQRSEAADLPKASAPPATPAPAAGAAYQEVPHTALRRTIARRMGEAKGGIPHFYMTADVDVTDVLALRERLNAAVPDVRVSVNDLLIKAVAVALEQVPALNATYADDGVRRYAAVHVGFATAIEEGLVTPVVRDCHLKSVGRIAREARDLAERARQRTLGAEDLQGGTFTLSNLGMYEVVSFAAIINPPQVGILAVARPVETPVADQGRVVFRKRLQATLSADHRAVDGVTGARFLAAFKAALEHPERLLL